MDNHSVHLSEEVQNLVDIATVKIDCTLPPRERVKDYLRQIKNPYCYIDNGIVVKLYFAPKGSRTLLDCLKSVALFELENDRK